MPDLDCIKKVVFKPLSKVKNDRRGTIAEFHIRDNIMNVSHGFNRAIERIQIICLAIFDSHPLGFGVFGKSGEQFEAWIEPGLDEDRIVKLIHKYWSEETIDVFKKVVLALAPIHKWEVSDES
ncbi:MAG: hypothetical protein WCT19_02840 [Candidatus Paceibacterota bacterium]|jgi:hypothetical protein